MLASGPVPASHWTTGRGPEPPPLFPYGVHEMVALSAHPAAVWKSTGRFPPSHSSGALVQVQSIEISKRRRAISVSQELLIRELLLKEPKASSALPGYFFFTSRRAASSSHCPRFDRSPALPGRARVASRCAR